jgi:hypothetical protein
VAMGKMPMLHDVDLLARNVAWFVKLIASWKEWTGRSRKVAGTGVPSSEMYINQIVDAPALRRCSENFVDTMHRFSND